MKRKATVRMLTASKDQLVEAPAAQTESTECGTRGAPRTCDVPAAARALGVSEFSVRELVRTRKLRSVRVGRLIRIPSNAIDDFLAAS